MNVTSDEVFDAIYDGNCETIDALIARGLAVDTCFGTDKWNFLHMALVSLTVRPDLKIVKHLVGLGVDVNARDWRHWTPLHFAVRTGSADIVKALIEAGADVDLPNDEGVTPLHLCLLKAPYSLEIIEMLLAAGANLDKDHGAGTVRNYLKAAAGPDIQEVLKLLNKSRLL